MDRRVFGTWGADLSDDDFSCALAAHGCLAPIYRAIGPIKSFEVVLKELDRTARDGLALQFEYFFPPLPFEAFGFNVRELVYIWNEFKKFNNRLRIHIQGLQWIYVPAGLPYWLLEQLSRPAVGLAGLYYTLDDPDAPITWKFPLRVGWLDDTKSRSMKRKMEADRKQHSTVSRLWSLVKLSSDRVECDILLMPQSLSSAVARILDLKFQIEADLVVVLDTGVESHEVGWDLSMLLRRTVECSAVAVSPVAPSLQSNWIYELISSISHNLPIDVALFAAAESISSASTQSQLRPLLVGSERFVENSRLQTRLKNLVTRMKNPLLQEKSVLLTERSACVRRLNIAAGRVRLDQLRSRLSEDSLENVFYRFEGDGATEIVDLDHKLKKLEAAIAVNTIDSTDSRFIQGRVYQESVGQARNLLQFTAGAVNWIEIRIGRLNTKWRSLVGQEFPLHSLPDELDEYRLDVALVVLSGGSDREQTEMFQTSQTDSIVLPVRGDSSSCHFKLVVSEKATYVRARIAVSFRGRVLQTAVLKGGVEGRSKETIDLDPEFATELRSDMLTQKRPFDVALILNHAENDQSGLTAITPTGVRFNVADDLDQLAKWFALKLSEVAYERKDYAEGLRSSKAAELLRLLARHGSMLRSAIKKAIGFDPESLGERIQVLTAHPDARLCLELVYDFASPEDEAPVCEHALEALRRGKCGNGCPMGDHKREVVCPLGFWATNKILERHAVERPVDGKNVEFRTRSSADQLLQVFERPLAASSKKIYEHVTDGMRQVIDALVAAFPNTSHSECLKNTWDDWRHAIGSSVHSLLLVTCHTETITGGIIQQMEIGDSSWLAADHVDASYVQNEGSQPIMLLLGCETGAPKVSLLSLVSKFYDAGAKIVVSTTSSIHATHAVPIAATFVQVLYGLCARRTCSLGEAMRELRRIALVDGFPAILCLTAFGDADYQLSKIKSNVRFSSVPISPPEPVT